MQTHLRSTLVSLVFLLGILSPTHLCFALNRTEFPARVTITLCPEFPNGGIGVELFYSVGDNPQLFPVTVTGQAINAGTNSGTFDVMLPATHGTANLNVVAQCRSALGAGSASNPVSISNCDALSLLDTDQDGIANNIEDSNCDNAFTLGDASNPDSLDTDGDGLLDFVEASAGTSLVDPTDSPRPMLVSGGPFDADGDGNSNPVVWRRQTSEWFVRDFTAPGNHIGFNFGLSEDIPFLYRTPAGLGNVGVIRTINNEYNWFFRGPGFRRNNNRQDQAVVFGLFGDNIILGPWETPGSSNPAVARLFAGQWFFMILLKDGTTRISTWGGTGDIPKVQDYDGDGLFDVAVFRPLTQETYIVRSSDLLVEVHKFGTITADYSVRGDHTGDGIDDISFWEPITGLFTTLRSDQGFNPTQASLGNPNHFASMQLGLFFTHVPLSWNKQNGKTLYTVIDHQSGVRFTRADNNPLSPVSALQWGLPGDNQG